MQLAFASGLEASAAALVHTPLQPRKALTGESEAVQEIGSMLGVTMFSWFC